MKFCKRLVAVCLLIAFLLPFSVLAEGPKVAASSAILVDYDSGRILYEQNPHEKRLIASITKLMTALVAVESHPDLTQEVEVKPEWTGAEGSSLYLKAGEVWRLETLLYGLLLHSGNDAAIAIAGFCAGDETRFVSWMNRRAQDLGMTSTRFQNPNGLNHEEHYSTAADMAKLAAACLRNEAVARIVATKSIAVEGRTFQNHNKLLWQYEGCIGMKTGYTQMAGRTLVSAARRDGQTLIVVTLNDPDDWKDHKTLYDYGFTAYPKHCFYEAGQTLTLLPVEGSLLRSVAVNVMNEVSYPFTEEEVEEAEITVSLPKTVKAPVQEGAIAGEVSLSLNGKILSKSYLLYGASIRRDAVVDNEGIRHLLELFRNKEKNTFLQEVLEGE
ncbi:MAG: D-alanyl-D-alanine carboxypeptidase [Firmicutes bacterium]|nr:D-alanyl-D-alanine carboxypeptidase [Bacillota bacterium]